MSALGSDFTGCTVFIYDVKGNHLADSVVTAHDRETHQIQVGTLPFEFKLNDGCKLLIMSSPAPCEFSGKFRRMGGNQYIAIFQGQERESRGSTRYPVKNPALVDAFIIDGQHHSIQTPVKVILINLSTTGVRFRAPYYSFDEGDELQMHMSVNNIAKRMIVKIINHVDSDADTSDYGCSFLLIE